MGVDALSGYWTRAWLTEYATRVIPDPRPVAILPGDPFLEEIRLRVRRGWQDALARRA